MIADGAVTHAVARLLTASYADGLTVTEADSMRATAALARAEHDAMRNRLVALEAMATPMPSAERLLVDDCRELVTEFREKAVNDDAHGGDVNRGGAIAWTEAADDLQVAIDSYGHRTTGPSSCVAFDNFDAKLIAQRWMNLEVNGWGKERNYASKIDSLADLLTDVQRRAAPSSCEEHVVRIQALEAMLRRCQVPVIQAGYSQLGFEIGVLRRDELPFNSEEK